MGINYGKIKYFKTCASIKDLPDDKLPEIMLAEARGRQKGHGAQEGASYQFFVHGTKLHIFL